MPKGGARKGAGRKPKSPEDALRSSPFRFRAATIERIRQLVEETGKTADEIVSEAIK